MLIILLGTLPLGFSPSPLAARPACRRAGGEPVMMGEYEKYLAQRKAGGVQGPSIDEAMEGLREFQKGGGDSEFDGGDSGGGVVGDGNTDLEDQHNSASIVRGGFGDAAVGEGGSWNVGRGMVKSATESRVASAGANYFGRSTGYADKKMDEITEDSIESGKLDYVRAQQLENWFNQRAIHQQNQGQGQGVVYGERQEGGKYIAREALQSNTWREGAKEGEVSQSDLANHLKTLASLPAQRLDGQDWGELVVNADDPVDEMFEVKSSLRNTHITEIPVRNDYNTFAPYRVGFVGASASEFDVSPNHGTMNRRSGEPVNLVVRFTPQEYGDVKEALLLFETEDMKKIFKFIGST